MFELIPQYVMSYFERTSTKLSKFCTEAFKSLHLPFTRQSLRMKSVISDNWLFYDEYSVSDSLRYHLTVIVMWTLTSVFSGVYILCRKNRRTLERLK